jgi:hypothetical protein
MRLMNSPSIVNRRDEVDSVHRVFVLLHPEPTTARAATKSQAERLRARKAANLPSPRERLLAACDELFYRDGVHSTGIDAVIEKADVAKGSLYYIFGRKDALVASKNGGNVVRPRRPASTIRTRSSWPS